MAPRSIVIGASAGGLEPLRDVVAELPANFPIPLFVVMHVAADHQSLLPGILNRTTPLDALHPQDGTRVEPGHIYIAPPDHHLLVDDGHVAVKKGPKENGFRPSIDALFRSAAYSFGPGAVGVVLSGDMNDGTSGLWSIKRLGGLAIIQEPNKALYPSMPRSALEYVKADYRGSAADIGRYLAQLPQPAAHPNNQTTDSEDARRMAIETQVAAGIQIPEQEILDLGELSPFTCPDCRGTLVKITEGKSFRFRCHTGHGFSADALLESLTATVGDIIWQATRGSQEVSMLLEHIALHLQENGEPDLAKAFVAKSREISRHASDLRKMALGNESLSEEKLIPPQ